MQLTDEQLAIIRSHVLECYPNEAVLVITEHDAIPVENIHADPANHFKIDSTQFYKNRGIALVHSHPYKLGDVVPMFGVDYVDRRVPSKADMETQQNMDVPFGIVACGGEEVTPVLWFPDLESPLLGHEYTHAVYDCYRVLRAWYWQQYGIFLPDYPRDFDWWKKTPRLYQSKS